METGEKIALAGVIIAVVSLVAFVISPMLYNSLAPTITETPKPTPSLIPTKTPIPPPTPTLSPTVTFTPTPRPFMKCFPEVSENRTKVMEAGTDDFLLIGPFESKDEPMVIKFTEYRNPIGYIKLFFFPDNKLTKIGKVVDSKCQQIEEYSHIEDGSIAKHVLQAWDPIKIKFENNNYLLTVHYDAEGIYAIFERTV